MTPRHPGLRAGLACMLAALLLATAAWSPALGQDLKPGIKNAIKPEATQGIKPEAKSDIKPDPQRDPQRDVTIAVSKGPVSLPLYVAQARGYFQAEGVNVQMRECSSGRTCFQLLADGQADLATAAELLVTLNSFKRADLAIIATLSASSQQIKLVARRSAGIQEPKHLEGKRIATVIGTSAQYFMDSWLIFQGIDPASVKLVGLQPDQIVDALKRQEVGAVVIWEPLASAAAAALGDDAMTMLSPRLYTQHFNLVTDRQIIRQREAALTGVLRALMRAERLIAEEPAAVLPILRERLGVDDVRAAGYLKEHDFRLRLDQSLVSTMESQARWAVHGGLVDRNAKRDNLLQTIQPALLRKAGSHAVTLVQ